MKITDIISWVRLFNRFHFCYMKPKFIFMLNGTNFVFMLFALMLFGT